MTSAVPTVAGPIGAMLPPETLKRAQRQADALLIRHSLKPAVYADLLDALCRAYAAAESATLNTTKADHD